MIYTREYIASAPKAKISVTYPDGAVMECELLAEGSLPNDIVRASRLGPAAAVELSRHLDYLRSRHADAYEKSGCTRKSSAWAVRR